MRENVKIVKGLKANANVQKSLDSWRVWMKVRLLTTERIIDRSIENFNKSFVSNDWFVFLFLNNKWSKTTKPRLYRYDIHYSWFNLAEDCLVTLLNKSYILSKYWQTQHIISQNIFNRFCVLFSKHLIRDLLISFFEH